MESATPVAISVRLYHIMPGLVVMRYISDVELLLRRVQFLPTAVLFWACTNYIWLEQCRKLAKYKSPQILNPLFDFHYGVFVWCEGWGDTKASKIHVAVFFSDNTSNITSINSLLPGSACMCASENSNK
jgi:hypothetical protein